MDGQLVRVDQLPSKGKVYPEDIEIYVKPLTIKEQMDMSRYGVSEAEYFKILLDGISVRGGFPKNKLLFHDVQFLDLVRRLYTFDVDQEIGFKGVVCECGNTFNGSFHFNELEFTDFPEDAFDQSYTFSDGLEVKVEPITIKDFINAGRKYFSSKKFSVVDIYLGYIILCIKDVVGREFKDEDTKQDFLYGYLANLYKASDRKILDEIESKCVSVAKPFKMICPKCGEEVEVAVSPTTQFQQ